VNPESENDEKIQQNINSIDFEPILTGDVE